MQLPGSLPQVQRGRAVLLCFQDAERDQLQGHGLIYYKSTFSVEG